VIISSDQLRRYAKQLCLPEFGEEGQKRLLQSGVLIIGCGGLGSAASYYLASAGIGRLGIADGDHVELSNLNRQIIHTTLDLNDKKTVSAEKKLKAYNPEIKVVKHPVRVNKKNVVELIKQYDFILDCTDNFEARYVINDACIRENKPFSHAGVKGFKGQTITVIPGGEGPCYRCIFSKLPENDHGSGIIGFVPGIIGTIQAAEAVKYIAGIGRTLEGRLLTFDALSMEFRVIGLKRNKKCPACKNR